MDKVASFILKETYAIMSRLVNESRSSTWLYATFLLPLYRAEFCM